MNKPETTSTVTSNKLTTNKFTEKYAGGYTVELANSNTITDAEVYILRPDGSAKRIHIKNENGNAQVDSEKIGTWSATENSISITCEGNSGPLTESFQKRNGVFYDTSTGDRYLKEKQ
jgi:phosphomannomutase